MNPGKKSNKHGDLHTVETFDRPTNYFQLVEPDHVLSYSSLSSYKSIICGLLTNFNGALFVRDKDLLVANTNLTLPEIKAQQDKKCRVNIESLLALLDGKQQSKYKNLDDFKPQIKIEVKQITLLETHWKQVVFKGLGTTSPYKHIMLDLNDFSLAELCLCNLIQSAPYFDKLYLNWIYCNKYNVAFERPINKQYSQPYNEIYKQFMAVEKDVTLELSFDLDLYFSHLKYLVKVMNTYNSK